MSGERVIKIGGAHLDDQLHLERLLDLVHGARDAGERVVLVHGGGPEIGALHDRLGVPFRKVDGLRVTTDESMPLVAMVLCGVVNKRLVAYLRHRDCAVIGASGVDLGLRSDFADRERFGRVGGSPELDATVLRRTLEPFDALVLAPVCLAPDGGVLNVNADEVAQSVAVALRASRLDLVTDVAAVEGPDGPIERVRLGDIETLVRDEIVTGGMIPKLRAAAAAVDRGVQRVLVGSLDSLTRGGGTEIGA